MDKELIQLALAIYDCKEALEWRMYEDQELAYQHLFHTIEKLDLQDDPETLRKVLSIDYDFLKEQDWSTCQNQTWLKLIQSLESFTKEDVLPKDQIIHDTDLLLQYMKEFPHVISYFPKEWLTEKEHVKQLCNCNIWVIEYVDVSNIDVPFLLEIMKQDFTNARYITLRLEGSSYIEVPRDAKKQLEIAKDVVENSEVMKLRMDTLKYILQIEDPRLFCTLSEETRNQKELYTIALKRMPELQVYVNNPE